MDKAIIVVRSLLVFLTMAFGFTFVISTVDAQNRSRGMRQVDKWAEELKVELDLTNHQETEIRDILMEAREDIEEDMREMRGDTTERNASVRDRFRSAADDIRELLDTEDQEREFAQIEKDAAQRLEDHLSGKKASKKIKTHERGSDRKGDRSDRDNDR